MAITTPIDSMLTNLLDRLVLMQKYIFDNTDAVPAAFYAQEAEKYWTNRIDDTRQELESEELVNVTFGLNMRLVLGLVTQDYDLAAERVVAQVIPPILYFFSARRLLKRTSADDALQWLRPEGAVITDANADYGSQNTGIGALHFAVDFTIEVPMYYLSEQAVF
jgi:uncharacterized protein Usg